MPTIDIHNHVVPDGFPAAAPSCGHGRWPSLVHGEGDQATVMIAGKPFRRFDSRSWDAARRARDMDAESVDVQVLSPLPELLSYWFDAPDGLAMARHMNRAIAEMVHAAPDRFMGLGMVPLQDPDVAAGELARLRDDLGLVGIEIGSNVNGKVPGDPLFEPFFAEAERLGLAVFVHAFHPAATERLVGPQMVQALVGFPTEIGLSAASVITGGLIERHPDLRIAFSHGGGTLAAILPRLEHGATAHGMLKELKLSPVEAAKRLYYDTLVFDPMFLAHLIARFGTSQLMVGTDYPATLRQPFPRGFVEKLSLAPAALEAVTGGNARRFLGLE
jgi:aminocarboxymuconate-semialdehyde decarboxylase